YTVEVVAGSQLSNHLLLERLPAIVTANPATLEFGENVSNTTLSFTILNPSYDDLDWQIETDCNWITVQPASGSLKYGKTETIVVNIDRTQLNSNSQKEGTDYESVIVVKSSDGNAEIKVKAIGKYHKNPEFNILETSEISAETAILNGTVTDGGEPLYTERGFVYHTAPSPTLDNTLERLKVQGTNNADYSYRLTGLSAGCTYYARAYVVNSYGVYYSSNEVHFTTKKTDLQVTVQKPNIDGPTNSAVLYGTIVGEGIAYTECGFVYGTTSNPTIGEDTKLIANAVGAGAYSVKVSDLPPFQTFYLKAYAISNGEVVYSESSVLLSSTPLPEVETEEPMDVNIPNGTATLKGKIVSAGYPVYTERGFVYGTMPEPTIYDNKIVANGSGIVSDFSIYTEELPKVDKYYVRAYAISEAGTVYGKIVVCMSEFIEFPEIGLAVLSTDIDSTKDKNSAYNMCYYLTIGGYTDWRLPERNELQKLYFNEKVVDGFFSSTKYWWYHSGGISTSSAFGYFDFKDGSLEKYDYYNTNYNTTYYISHVRCVRTIKKQ
ncbi:MAG: hypothetical protein K2O69_04635, partial [Odoribacter sp.]|nr:hypothetical protein [Odoribacter sp.]